MTYFICKTCGVQYEASENPPLYCPICEDERQYVPETGQAWTTLDDLRRDYKVVIKEGGAASLRNRHRTTICNWTARPIDPKWLWQRAVGLHVIDR